MCLRLDQFYQFARVQAMKILFFSNEFYPDLFRAYHCPIDLMQLVIAYLVSDLYAHLVNNVSFRLLF
jgi:hypothetical protein